MPIYYADIVKEWQDRNGDARGLAHEQGMDEGSEGDAYKLMSMDLYCLYDQELREDYNKLIDLMDEQEDDEDEETAEPVNCPVCDKPFTDGTCKECDELVKNLPM